MPLRRAGVGLFTLTVPVPPALANVGLHRPGAPRMVDAQLRHLGRALAGGAGERMQDLALEGYVFTWALYGLASPAATLPLLRRARAAWKTGETPA